MRGRIKLIVKVTIPLIVQDNPMCTFTTRDGKFHQQVPVNMTIIKWLNGKSEGFFELWMTGTHIISMKPVSESLYYTDEDPKPEVSKDQIPLFTEGQNGN